MAAHGSEPRLLQRGTVAFHEEIHRTHDFIPAAHFAGRFRALHSLELSEQFPYLICLLERDGKDHFAFVAHHRFDVLENGGLRLLAEAFEIEQAIFFTRVLELGEEKRCRDRCRAA